MKKPQPTTPLKTNQTKKIPTTQMKKPTPKHQTHAKIGSIYFLHSQFLNVTSGGSGKCMFPVCKWYLWNLLYLYFKATVY